MGVAMDSDAGKCPEEPGKLLFRQSGDLWVTCTVERADTPRSGPATVQLDLAANIFIY